MSYIDRDEFVKEQRHLYCDNCGKRKGMKNGKMRFVYEIGDAPCRACGIGDVLDDLEDAPSADVVEQKRGRWELDILDGTPVYGPVTIVCSECHRISFSGFPYCPNCGAKMEEQI